MKPLSRKQRLKKYRRHVRAAWKRYALETKNRNFAKQETHLSNYCISGELLRKNIL